MSIDTTKLFRENILNLHPYSSARSEFRGNASVFLDANENSLGKYFHRYPDPVQTTLRQKISILKTIPAANIFIGNGSDEPIDLLIRATCRPGIDNILLFPPTYGMYQVAAQINDVKVTEVLLSSDFQIPIDEALAAISNNTKLIFICTPNNPTGNLLYERDIQALLCSFPGLVVIDEAYIDFADTTSWVSYMDDFPNLVVLQTLSKAWGLAALRIGLAFGSKTVIDVLNKIKPPYNISTPAQEIALQMLDRKEEMEHNVSVIRQQRAMMRKELAALQLVEKVFPSDANFLLAKVKDADYIYNALLAKNIILRNRSKMPLCDNCLRITIGSEGENIQLLKALTEIEDEEKAIVYR